jgi:hypothetical protein
MLSSRKNKKNLQKGSAALQVYPKMVVFCLKLASGRNTITSQVFVAYKTFLDKRGQHY